METIEHEGTVLQRTFYYVYQEDDTTYYTMGSRLSDLMGIKMLKASCKVVTKPNVRHIKQLIFKFSKMTESGGLVDFTGCGIGFYNIPTDDVVAVA